MLFLVINLVPLVSLFVILTTDVDSYCGWWPAGRDQIWSLFLHCGLPVLLLQSGHSMEVCWLGASEGSHCRLWASLSISYIWNKMLLNSFLCFDVGLHCKAQQMIFFSHTVSCRLEFIITICLLLLLKHSFFHSFLLSPNVSFCRSQTGVHIFTKRPKSRNGSNLSPDDVVTYLGKHSRALLLYLEHLVLEEKIQVQMDLLISSWRPMWPGGFRVNKSIQP